MFFFSDYLAHTEHLCGAGLPPENVKLPTSVSVKLPVKAIYLVYMCQQGTIVDMTHPQSLNWWTVVCTDQCCSRDVCKSGVTESVTRNPVVYSKEIYYTLSGYFHDVFAI